LKVYTLWRKVALLRESQLGSNNFSRSLKLPILLGNHPAAKVAEQLEKNEPPKVC